MASKLFGLKHRFGSNDPWDYASIKSLDEFKALVVEATVIGFVDVNGKGDGVVFGREILKAISQGVIPPQQLRLVLFGIDYRSGQQFEHLLASVQTAKGFYEWPR